MTEDNWKHRSEGMRCKTCMYYVNARCRRHAPTMQGYPAVFPNDWCGDRKLDKEFMSTMEKPSVESEMQSLEEATPIFIVCDECGFPCVVKDITKTVVTYTCKGCGKETTRIGGVL